MAHGGVHPRYALMVDLSGDGRPTETGNIIDHVKDIDTWRGKDYATHLVGKSSAGRLTATLHNHHGDFSPFNVASPYYGGLRPGRRLLLLGGHTFMRMTSGGGYMTTATPPITTQAQSFTVSFRAKWTQPVGNSWVWSLNETLNAFTTHRFAVGTSTSRGGGAGVLKFAMRSSDGVNNYVASTITPASGAWYVVTASFFYSGALDSSIMRLYINGVQVGGNVTPTGTVAANLAQFVVGRQADVRWEGDLSELRFYNYALSPSEVATDYNTRWLGGAETGLIGYWQMNESVYVPLDLTDNARHMTRFDNTAWRFSSDPIDVLPANTALWSGYISKLSVQDHVSGEHMATIEGYGAIGHFSQYKVSTDIRSNQEAGYAMRHMAEKAGVPYWMRNFEPGVVVFSKWWVERRNMINVMHELEEADQGILHEDARGRLIYRGRNWRNQPENQVSQALFSDDPADVGAFRYQVIGQRDPDEFIFTEARAKYRLITVGSGGKLWEAPSTYSIAPGASIEVWANYPNELSPEEAIGVNSWSTPTATTDYTANTAEDGSGTDLTASMAFVNTMFAQSIKMVITNNSVSTAYIRGPSGSAYMQVRGTPLSRSASAWAEARNDTAVLEYGPRTFEFQTEFFTDRTTAYDACETFLSRADHPVPVISIDYNLNVSDAAMQLGMSDLVGNRITVKGQYKSTLNISGLFFIEAVGHHISNYGISHSVHYELSQATEVAGDKWVVGTSALGISTFVRQ